MSDTASNDDGKVVYLQTAAYWRARALRAEADVVVLRQDLTRLGGGLGRLISTLDAQAVNIPNEPAAHVSVPLEHARALLGKVGG